MTIMCDNEIGLDKFKVDGVAPTIDNNSVVPIFPIKKRKKYTKHSTLTDQQRKELRFVLALICIQS